MKYDNIVEDLKNRIYHPLYFLSGEEPYFIDKISKIIENTVLAESEKDFNEVKRLQVKWDNIPVSNINELEYINGKIFANIWMTDYIAIICPKTGAITNILDLQDLNKDQKSGREDVLNGIAYDMAGDRLFVTGKRWPFIYEIAIIPR